MSVAYDQFLSEVLPYALDVGEPQALFAVRNTCIDFCERTSIWQQRGVTLTMSEGQTVYKVPVAPLDARHVRISRMYVEDRLLRPESEDSLANGSSRNWREEEGDPHAYFEIPDGSFSFDRKPDRTLAGGIVLDSVLAPTRDSEEIGLDLVYEKYLEVIACGALYRLFMTPGQPYYNPEMGLARQRMYTTGISAAKDYVNRGHGRGATRVAPMPFARGNKTWR